MSKLYKEKVRDKWNRQINKYTFEKEGYHATISVDPVSDMVLLLAQDPSGKIIEGYALKNKDLKEVQRETESKICNLILKNDKIKSM